MALNNKQFLSIVNAELARIKDGLPPILNAARQRLKAKDAAMCSDQELERIMAKQRTTQRRPPR